MHTSANINSEIAFEIMSTSVDSGISISQIIKMLIITAEKQIKHNSVNNRLVEYQNNGNSDYTKLDYYVNNEFADTLCNLRFSNRISISKIICASFILFWDHILCEIYGNHDHKQDRIEYYNLILRNYELKKLYNINVYNYFLKRLNFNFTYNIRTAKLE